MDASFWLYEPGQVSAHSGSLLPGFQKEAATYQVGQLRGQQKGMACSRHSGVMTYNAQLIAVDHPDSSANGFALRASKGWQDWNENPGGLTSSPLLRWVPRTPVPWVPGHCTVGTVPLELAA